MTRRAAIPKVGSCSRRGQNRHCILLNSSLLNSSMCPARPIFEGRNSIESRMRRLTSRGERYWIGNGRNLGGHHGWRACLGTPRRARTPCSTDGSAPRTAAITAQLGMTERQTPLRRRIKVRGCVTSLRDRAWMLRVRDRGFVGIASSVVHPLPPLTRWPASSGCPAGFIRYRWPHSFGIRGRLRRNAQPPGGRSPNKFLILGRVDGLRKA